MGADYSSYVKSIATCASTFFEYVISVFSVIQQTKIFVTCQVWLLSFFIPTKKLYVTSYWYMNWAMVVHINILGPLT